MKKLFLSTNSGVSGLELVLVAAILGLLLAVILPSFSKNRELETLNTATGDILSALSQARAQTLAGLNSSSYGVRFAADEVIIFKGENFSAGALDNYEIDIVSPATISNVTLGGVSGSTGELYFERLSGNPSKSGSITLSSPEFSKTITITATGSASVN